MLKRILILAAVLPGLTACKDSGVDGEFSHPLTQKEVPGIYSENKNVFVYDNEIHQYAFNTMRRTFRIQTTAQDRYFACTLENDPVVGETVIIRVETKGISSLPSQEIQVRVLKISDGMAWLIEEQKNTGFVIRLE